MDRFPKYAAVILDISLNKALDYGIPEHMAEEAMVGRRVEVPVRGTLQKGYILEIKETPGYPKVQPIANISPNSEVLTKELFQLALWMSNYYCASLSDVLKTIVPATLRKETKEKQQLFVIRAKTRDELREHCASIQEKHPAQAAILEEMLKASKGMFLSELLEKCKVSKGPLDTLVKKGMLAVDIVRVDRSPLLNEDYFQTKAKTLNEDQQMAINRICQSLDQNLFETHLLFGITGSGKTEVYLQAIEKALQQGKGTIMLVPEISLTAQTIERFKSRFKDKIAILHHRLSDGERFDEWNNIFQGSSRIVVGARSAIFSPVKNLGLIIVDEEHEPSYKSTEHAPCYHARDIAVMRGKFSDCPVILGSATPSLESYYNCEIGKYRLSILRNRAEKTQLPTIKIVDMRHEFEKAKGFTNFSEALLSAIQERKERGEQSILFLNRRGYHTTLFCTACSTAIKCDHCEIALTFHQNENSLSCHLCGFTVTPPPIQCPGCKMPNPMKFRGVGTELIEKNLHAVFPDIRTIRMDADTTKHKGSHQKLLKEFATGKADVLIGTQMIAKGLHFSEVTLVGVLNSDSSLNLPDFRASESVFQLITQVAGRAGRSVLPGEVIIQTMMPENQIIKLAARQNYEEFYKEEIEVRKMFGFPPVNSMAKLLFSGADCEQTLKAGQDAQQFIRKRLGSEFEVHPVLACGYAKIKDKFRFQFLIRGPGIGPIGRAIRAMKEAVRTPGAVKVLIDINPTTTYF